MKNFKYIIISFLIVFCFILNGELYQNYTQNFSNQFFYFDVCYDDRVAIYNTILKASDKYNVEVFSVSINNQSAHETNINIKSTSGAERILNEQYNISEGTKTSFLSGQTTIEFQGFKDIISDDSIERFYFIGDKDDVSDVKNFVYSYIPTSYIHREPFTGNEWLIIGVWGLVFIFSLLITWIDIQLQKKENFLLISFGKSKLSIIFKNCIKDSIIILFSFFLSYKVLSQFIYVNFFFKESFLLLVIFLCINIMLHFSLSHDNYKQIISGANVSEKTLANLYLMKAITLIVAIASLATNFSLILENTKYLICYETISNLQEYESFNLVSKDGTNTTEELNLARTTLFLDSYKNNQVAFSTSFAKINDEPIICINNNAISMISDKSILDEVKNKEFYIFIPTSYPYKLTCDDISFILESSSVTLFGLNIEDITFDTIYYETNNIIYFDFGEASELPLGYEIAENPIFIYCNISNKLIDTLIKTEVEIEYYDHLRDIFFKTSQIDLGKTLCDNFIISNCNGVIEVCEQYKNTMLRIVFLNTLISIFLLALSIFLVVSIIKFEYTLNAKELAIKKILGYSIVKKNSIIMILNMFATLIGVTTCLILSAMYNIASFQSVIIMSIILCVFECTLIIYNIKRFEKSNIPKILKGGSL